MENYIYIYIYILLDIGDRGVTVVKVLCYKSEDGDNPSNALGSTQPLTEMSTRSISWE